MKGAVELISLKGRRVLVTGAASGIGLAMALRFAEAGAEVVLVDRDVARLEGAVGQVAAAAGRAAAATGVVADLSVRREIASLWDGVGAPLPDTLVNNAGIYPMKDYLDVDEPFLEKVLAVNLNSMIWMCQEFIRRRQGRGGNIINVSSIEAVLPFTHDLIPYGVSKAGVLALTRGLARDYGRQGFRANVILPGAIRTPGTSGLKGRAIRHLRTDLVATGFHFQHRLALGRWGNPDEVARVALFLASDLASYVQGALIPVDGGFLSS